MGNVIAVDFKTKTIVAHAVTREREVPEVTLQDDMRFYKRNDTSKMAIMEALLRAKEITTVLAFSPENPDVLCRLWEMRTSSLEDVCLVLNESTRESWKAHAHYFFALSMHFSERLQRVKLCVAHIKSSV